MSARHTPGPWQAIGTCVGNAKGERRFVVGITRTAYASQDEMRANARLIAAAPELLEALEAVDRMFSEPGKWNKISVRDCVRAAIAKATGDA